ncbi:MAG: peptidylprolyl isomerase [candidate division Zixibacteria bacterium]|nr:peptidylprolyl isomerase [candidate division Zixibacteria bacterium]
MKRAKLLPLTLLLVAICFCRLSAWERVDNIVAVVGDKIILASELDYQVQIYAVQSGIKLADNEKLATLKRELLAEMINDRLILVKAKEDTTIVVSDDEIEAAFNQRIEELQSRFASPKAFNEQLAAEGLTFRDLKVSLRQQITEQIYKERLISRLLSKVSVTKREVEEFFETYQDSFPEHPRSVKLARILLRLKSAEVAQDSLRELAESLAVRIKEGESFEELAKLHSDDNSAPSGGDIGSFHKGDLLPEIEKAALALAPDGVSGVVRTSLGFHIVKLVEKSVESFHCKHILLMDKPVASDSARIADFAADLVTQLNEGADWGSMVKEYSDDESNKATFGELGWLAIDNLPPVYRDGTEGLAVGGISQPIWAEEGLLILKVLDRSETRPFSLEEDWDIVKEYARQRKSGSVIAAVVAEMKEKVYLELREE